MTNRYFHLAPLEAWIAARGSGSSSWSPPSLASEGFVHLSFAEQLAGTLAVHFAKDDRVLVLELDLTDDGALRLEPSRGGALFPHLYRALRFDEVAHEHVLDRPPGGWLTVTLPRP